MTLNLQNRRMEEEIVAHRKNETDFSEKLLEAEHHTMELRFEREQARARISRLENRLLELELVGPLPEQDGVASSGHAAARTTPTSRQVRSLEQVIEGLERVITQQKNEMKRAKDELDGRKDDRRHKAEVARLKKQVNDLSDELGGRDQQLRRQGGGGAGANQRARQDLDHARAAQHLAQSELQQKEAQIAALERQLTATQIGSHDAAGGGQDAETVRLEGSLRELQFGREADAKALEEAHKTLHEAELNEKRYVEVARENKRLRAEMGALEDEGFWREIEGLQARGDEAAALLSESREALCSLFAAFPSLEPPSGLLSRIEHHITAAATAA